MTSPRIWLSSVAAVAALVSSCGQPNSSSSSAASAAATPRAVAVSDLSSFVGAFAFAKGDAECAPKLIIESAPDFANTLSVYGRDENGAGAGGSRIFYGIGGHGNYSFNSSNSTWTWSKASVDGDSIVYRDVSAPFVKPLKFLARERSRLSVGDGVLVFTGSMWNEELSGPKAFSCTYAL